MRDYKPHQPLNQTGFSLVEILVGLVIGLLTTLVIMQVFSVFEGQKRTTSGSADAQTSGSIALYTIARELQMAGYGLVPSGRSGEADSPLECTSLAIDAASGYAAASGVSAIAPVIITDGGTGAGASDSITIHTGSTPTAGIPTPLTQSLASGASAVAFIDNNLACQLGDFALVINGAACTMSNITALTASSTVPASITLRNSPATAPSGTRVACIGNWNESLYSVSSVNNISTLALRTGIPNVAQSIPIVSDIVNIQAQYGIAAAGLLSSTNNFNQVTQWVNATGGTWAAPSVVNRNRIKAVRLAVVARNGLLEKSNVTSTCTTAKGIVNNGPCAWDDTNFDAAPKIDLSNDANWQRYRYRVYETIVPLRNVIWSRPTL